MQIILEWSTGQKKSVPRFQLSDSLWGLTLLIFNFMCFINNYILPLKFLESTHAHSHTLKSCDADIKITWLYGLFNNVFAELLFRDQVANPNSRVPYGEFTKPVSNNRLGHDNQVIALYLFKFSHEAQQRNCLDCLSKAHLVSQNAINACLIKWDHPVEPIELVVS